MTTSNLIDMGLEWALKAYSCLLYTSDAADE